MKIRIWESAEPFGWSIDLEHVSCVERKGSSAKVYLAGDRDPLQLDGNQAEAFLAAWRAYHTPDVEPDEVERLRSVLATGLKIREWGFGAAHAYGCGNQRQCDACDFEAALDAAAPATAAEQGGKSR